MPIQWYNGNILWSSAFGDHIAWDPRCCCPRGCYWWPCFNDPPEVGDLCEPDTDHLRFPFSDHPVREASCVQIPENILNFEGMHGTHEDYFDWLETLPLEVVLPTGWSGNCKDAGGAEKRPCDDQDGEVIQVEIDAVNGLVDGTTQWWYVESPGAPWCFDEYAEPVEAPEAPTTGSYWRRVHVSVRCYHEEHVSTPLVSYWGAVSPHTGLAGCHLHVEYEMLAPYFPAPGGYTTVNHYIWERPLAEPIDPETLDTDTWEDPNIPMVYKSEVDLEDYPGIRLCALAGMPPIRVRAAAP